MIYVFLLDHNFIVLELLKLCQSSSYLFLCLCFLLRFDLFLDL